MTLWSTSKNVKTASRDRWCTRMTSFDWCSTRMTSCDRCYTRMMSCDRCSTRMMSCDRCFTRMTSCDRCFTRMMSCDRFCARMTSHVIDVMLHWYVTSWTIWRERRDSLIWLRDQNRRVTCHTCMHYSHVTLNCVHVALTGHWNRSVQWTKRWMAQVLWVSVLIYACQ